MDLKIREFYLVIAAAIALSTVAAGCLACQQINKDTCNRLEHPACRFGRRKSRRLKRPCPMLNRPPPNSRATEPAVRRGSMN